MINRTKTQLYTALRWTERYTKTDMVYFARGNFWLMLGRIVASSSGFLLTIAFANLLSPESFGTYKYLVAIAAFIGAFSLNGIGGAALRAIGKGYQDVIPSLFRSAIIWSIPASILALVGSGYYLIKGNGVLGWSLFVIALLNPIVANLAISKSLFVATGDFRRATFYNTIRSTTQVAVIALSLLLTDNVLIITSTFFIVSALVGYLTYWHSLRILNIKNDPTHLPETFSYAKHLSMLGTLQLVVGQLDQLLLWHFAGPVALATYAIALGPTRELRSLSENLTALAFPKLSVKSKDDASQAVRTKSLPLFIIYVGIAATYIAIAPFAFNLLFPQYLAAVLPSQFLALGFILQSRAFADVFLFSHGTIKDRYWITLPGQLIKMALLIILIPLHGLSGAVAAALVSELCTALVISQIFKRHRVKLT